MDIKSLSEPLANPIAYLDAHAEHSLKGYASVLHSHLKCRHRFGMYMPDGCSITFADYDARVREHWELGTPWNLAAAEIASWLADHGCEVRL